MLQTTESGPLILGASGQIGQMWRRLWAQGLLDFEGTPLWQVRQKNSDDIFSVTWDILREPAPNIAPSAVICLAGSTEGHMGMNCDLALAAVTVARGAPVLFASTQAVYGVQPGALSETSLCQPHTAYGRAKLAAEQAIADHPNVTSLRIGNAIGADALLRAARRGPVGLDQFADKQGPRRMMIGPLTLARACVDLLALGNIAVPVLNLAQPGLVAMADLLKAVDVPWFWQSAPQAAISALEMDLNAVQNLIMLPAADPDQLMSEVRAAGLSA